MKLVKNKKMEIEGTSFYISVDKEFYYRVDIDYYVYIVTIYKLEKIFMFNYYKQMWDWKSYWLDYRQYHGNIDLIINTGIRCMLKNIKEQKYINENEKRL